MATNKKRKRLYIFGGIIVFLIAVRLVLPFIVLRYANNSLAHMHGYYGHVNDIDISLYRGAYQIKDIYINKSDSASGKQTPFFSSKKIDLSVEWSALLDGSLVGELEFFSPKIIFTKNKTEIGQVAKDTNDFRKVLKDFMPLKINRFQINDGSIHYVDNTASPKVDIFLTDTYATVRNLKNTEDRNEKLPSTLKAKANVYGGTLNLDMRLNILTPEPAFVLKAEMKNANLARLNDFFKAYGKFDIEKGSLGLYSEFAAEQGKFKGYVKPIIKDLKVVGPQDKNDGILQKLKEEIIGVAGTILKNPKEKQVATKVPIEGRFDDPSVKNLEAVWQLLKNAFIHALLPAVDNEISLQSVESLPTEPEKKEGFFKRLFGKKDKQK
jgi:hypothetical protein